MQNKKLFLKLFSLILLVFLLGCTQTQSVSQDDMDDLIHELQTAYPDNNLDKLMQEHNVVLTAKEVQYNMSNNVGKKFGLEGMAEICNYYNWGYDKSIESDYFCMHVTPNGGYLESWYIYMDRTTGSKLYQDLLIGNRKVTLIAIIDSIYYEENQQNQARGLSLNWSRYNP